jgi:hypothetical protein
MIAIEGCLICSISVDDVRREDEIIGAPFIHEPVDGQIASMTEKTFQLVTIWLHKPSINSKHYRLYPVGRC